MLNNLQLWNLVISSTLISEENCEFDDINYYKNIKDVYGAVLSIPAYRILFFICCILEVSPEILSQ